MKTQIMVIAAISDKDMLLKACETKCKIVFDLAPNIEQIEEYVAICHRYNKTIFVHIDLAEGIGKDKYGLRFLKKLGVDGIISTRAVMIKAAKELEMKTVQRIFILDSHSLRTAEAIVKNGADMIEIMPGIIPAAIRELHENVDTPIIAGGLVRNEEDVRMILEAGAVAASTSESDLW